MMRQIKPEFPALVPLESTLEVRLSSRVRYLGRFRLMQIGVNRLPTYLTTIPYDAHADYPWQWQSFS